MTEHDVETTTPAVQYQVVAVGGSAQIIAFPSETAGKPAPKADETTETVTEGN
ncbi:MAG: hypothetical protein PHS60_02300 [Zavarzinia sp.]|nr:hypothetical protein [Zavarzinia sp.]